jgi:hypothetical protein
MNNGDVLKKYNALRTLTDNELDASVKIAVEKGRHRIMSRAEKEAQLVSFVWGIAPEGNQGTRETVRENLGLLPA